ncbi:MAG TPA: chemotaxis protein CheW [Alphaproteobacteria bacterium]|nr:chemotaxis protein CheW [Alphaproteobacteria bacterium]
MDDLLREFLTESAESLAVLDLELVRLEKNPNDQELLSNIFRLVHTVKGTCGFLGLPRLEAVAHAGENVLGRIREGKLSVDAQAITLILTSIDCIKSILAEIERTEAEPEGNDADLIARLNAFAESADAPATVAPTPAEPVVAKVEAAPAAPAHVETAAPSAAKPGAKPAEGGPATAEATQTIRVNVGLLENLMNLVSEMVLTRNQLLQIVRGRNDTELTVPLQRLSHTTTELQEGVMKTRMQPIGNAWNQLPRIVRDLARDLGKEITLEMHGAETELDRQVLELIKDPLTHMVRNSGDHGLEKPEDRRAAGKPDTGKIVLEAFHEGGHIIVKISDDGRGLALKRIKDKALQQGLVTETDLAQMSENQIQQLIFRAGFSTAEKVTNVSGRGVGMDVVRTNIEKIGGTIEMKSVEGKGTTFTIKIPLTLAIVSALIVECANERFAVPQINVVELVRAGGKSDHAIEKINGTPVLRLREALLPLVSLRRLLKLDATDIAEPDEAFVIVTAVGSQHFGIIVDRVFDTEEIVVKPVAPILRDISLYSGNTILGDGSVVMILDPNGIASTSGAGEISDDRTTEEAHAAARGEDRSAILLFRAGGNTPKAVPLSLVARLEEIDVAAIERSNGMPVVQYRGQLMPLVTVNDNAAIKDTGRQPVVVFTDDSRSMGLIVDEITDIVEDTFALELASGQPGVVGSAVIAGKATEVIDVAYYMGIIHADWTHAATGDEHKRVLLVDDSPFFRNLLKPLLAVAGYEVTAVESAEEALRLRDRGESFDVIVSDITMPGIDGCALASEIRSGGAWQATPLVALAANASDIQRGQAAGFNDLAAKFDREAIVSKVSQTLLNLQGAA